MTTRSLPWVATQSAVRRPTSTTAPVPLSIPRLRAIDLARGLAIALMILSHGINGLLSFEQIPHAGMMLHAFTKFSSSLFILVFGVALGLAFVPYANSPVWPRKRARLLWNGFKVLVCYKLLTVVELASTRPDSIVDALLYRDFPSYVEILGFYAIALLWLPFALPLWSRLPFSLRLASPLLAAALSAMLLQRFDFWGVPQLQALLVEHPDYYTWGQLSRLPLVLAGLLIGVALRDWQTQPHRRIELGAGLIGAGILALALFVYRADDPLGTELLALAHNAGKHPPETMFMLFSLGGALTLLGASILGGERAARWLAPLTVIGSSSLKAFLFHIVVIFGVLRWGLGYIDTLDYGTAMALTLGILAATAGWIALWQTVSERIGAHRYRACA
jgi:uncharacterized membrane protein